MSAGGCHTSNATAQWPGGADFALFLSHDVDQVHDRGLYRTLADINHLRRVISGQEVGAAAACCSRIGRALLRPKGWQRQFERILELESAHGWRSTFFFLEGNSWSRYGARYTLEDPRIRELASLLVSAGCELGVHGGYHDFNKADGYRRSADLIEKAFGIRPVGIRNHFLKFSYPETWLAQAEAGFLYDATFGFNDRPGFRDGRMHPFIPKDPLSGAPINIMALPLTVMDATLFRVLGLGPQEALRMLGGLLDQVRSSGGLLTLLWHNNYFDEPEYRMWEDVYAEFLRRVAAFKPYCGTGAEIAQWCRSHTAGMEA